MSVEERISMATDGFRPRPLQIGGGGSGTPQGGFIEAAIDAEVISAAVAPDLQASLINDPLNVTVGGEITVAVGSSSLSATVGGDITAEIDDGEL